MPSCRPPIVRHFLACDDIAISADGRQISLTNLIHALRLKPGALFPHVVPQICLFAQLTDAHGDWPITVQLWQPRLYGEDSLLFPAQPRKMSFGSDPLVIHGLPIRLRNIVFPAAGLYEFRLLCDQLLIAREPILVR
jgi:uncharacterized protein DUF6941